MMMEVEDYQFDKSLLPARIKQAEGEFVEQKYRPCTVILAPSPSINVGDFVRFSLNAQNAHHTRSGIFEITAENVKKGVVWEVEEFPVPGFDPKPGAEVTIGYQLTKKDNERFNGPKGKYIVR